MNAASSFFTAMVVTVEGIYQVNVVGLNPLQLVLVGTVLEASIFVCEVPTGVVADVYSRRLSIIIGTVLIGAGFILWGAIPLFVTVLLAQVLLGVGFTFTSGAESAWISDEIGEVHAPRFFLESTQVRQVGDLFGILAGVGLGTLRLNLPFVLGGLLFFGLAVFLMVAMPEAGFVRGRHADRTTWQKLSLTFKSGIQIIRRRPVLATILGIGIVFGAASEAFDRLWEVHFLKDFTFPSLGHLQPVLWFGIINVGVLLLTLAATGLVRRRLEVYSHSTLARVLLAINGLLMVAMISFGLAGGFALALGAYWAARTLRNVYNPLYTAWLNQGLDPEVRATILSMGSQADAFGQIAGGPLLGVVANVYSIRTALVAVGVILSPIVMLLKQAARS